MTIRAAAPPAAGCCARRIRSSPSGFAGGRRSVLLAYLAFLLGCQTVAAAGPNCQDANGDPAEGVNLRSECNTESLIPSESGCFDRKRDVFGITIWATPDLPEWALDHSVAVFSQLLDSDEDGVADYPNLVAYLTQWVGAEGAVGRTRDYAVIQCRGDIGSGALKDILFGVTRTGGQTTLNGDTEFMKVALEEFHHTVHKGLEGLHPNVFGINNPNSELLLAFAQAIDDCQVANECCTDAVCDCSTYDCTCEEAGGTCTANEYSCSFVQGSCSGVYHYPDVGCGRTCAGGGEFYYIAWMTYYGFNQASGPLGGDCQAVSPVEWEVCASADLVANPKTQLIYNLVAGLSASKATEGYIQPSTLPNGVYTATRQPVTGVTWSQSSDGGDDADASDGEDDADDMMLIIGVVVAVIAFIAIAIVTVVCCKKKSAPEAPPTKAANLEGALEARDQQSGGAV